MQIPIDKQKEFLTWQIKEHEIAFLNYLRKPMKQHFRDKTAFCGNIWGVDEKRSSLILRFPKGLAPRLNYPMSGFIYSGVPNPDDFSNWEFSYEDFRKNYTKGKTDLSPIYYMNKEDQLWTYIGCREIEAEFFSGIQKLIEKGNKPSIVLGEKDPPIQYLLNLREFISGHPDDEVLNLSLKNVLDEWKPEQLHEEYNKCKTVVDGLKEASEIIIQGPPGTGKSHLVAEIAGHYLSTGQSVCITSLTNKALMEVAEKPGINQWIEKGSVFKTNLTAEEVKKKSKLKRGERLTIGRSQLLLATYYKLSDWYRKENSEAQNAIKPIYDLVIIEEASQCFLATIAAFKILGHRVLIVGDPLQLPPIVLNENAASTIHPHIMLFARGLESYAANSNVRSFILSESYRLSREAARCTGLFYKNQLRSVQSGYKQLKASLPYQSLLPTNASSLLAFLPLIAEGDRPQNAINLVVNLTLSLRESNPDLEVAVLAPFKNTVLAIQEKMGAVLNDFSGITIETIDRIQGLTVDFTIYVLALNNPSFALNLNRFNVATSRAKSGTLIITDREYIRFMGIHPLVTTYLRSIESINL